MKLSNLSKTKIAVLALIAANIIWGASFPIYKWALEDIPPFTFIFWRFFLGALLILPFTIHDLKIEKKDISKLIGLSLSGITLMISFLFLGLKLAPSINAPIILSSTPIILILVAIFYLKEKQKTKTIIGTWISLLGVLIIIIRPLLESGLTGAVLGNFFFLLAAIGNITYIVLLEKIAKSYPVLKIIFWSFVIGSIPLIPLVVYEAQNYNLISNITFQGLFGIIYGTIFAAVLAHLLSVYGMKYIRTGEVGIFSYVDPVATALVAIPLLGESITFSYLLGAVFVFMGIFVAEGRIHYHPFHLLRKKEEKIST